MEAATPGRLSHLYGAWEAPLQESFSLDISNTGPGDISAEAGVISKQVSKQGK